MPTLIKAKVKYPAGPPREGNYGPRINVVAIAENGEEFRIWGNPDNPIAHLKKGQEIQALKDEKGNFSLLQTAADLQTDSRGNSVPATRPPEYEPLTNQQKAAIAAYVQEQASLLGYCMEVVQHDARLAALSEEGQRASATTLYIQVQKKFGG